MTRHRRFFPALSLTLSITVTALAAMSYSAWSDAQLLDSLKGKLSGGGDTASQTGGGLAGLTGGSSLGGGALSSLSSGSTGNIAGVLQFCIKNNYLSGNGVSSVKDKILGKIPGNQPKSDPGYLDGAKGILDGGDGKKLSLGGEGGLKAQVTKKVCDQVLSQGKSLL